MFIVQPHLNLSYGNDKIPKYVNKNTRYTDDFFSNTSIVTVIK